MQSDYTSEKPLWSVMIPTYNPVEAYFCEAVRSILRAVDGLPSVQIEVVDDASPDVDVRTLLAKANPDGRISIHRRDSNGGLAACWNDCISRAKGKFVHLLHQDDLVYPGFYQRLEAILGINESVGMAFCRFEFIDGCGKRKWVAELEQQQGGIVDDWVDRIARNMRVQCPAVVVRRCVYDAIGGFCPELKFIVDWEMWVRVASRYPVAYVPEVLAAFREHGQSESSRLEKGDVFAADFERCLAIMEKTLPADVAGRVIGNGCRFAADFLGTAVRQAAGQKRLKTATRYLAAQIEFLNRSGARREALGLWKWWMKMQAERVVRWIAGSRT